MILKAVVNFTWFDIDYTSIQWLIKMNINSYVNKVWTERVDNKFRQQFDKVLEKYQATMHRALSRRPSFLLLITFFRSKFLLLIFSFPLFGSLTHASSSFYTFLLFIHTRLGFLTQFYHFDTSKHLFTLSRGRHRHK